VLRVAGEESVGVLLADARRIAEVSHPNLVSVLAAGRSGSGGYAAMQDVAGRPLSEIGEFPTEESTWSMAETDALRMSLLRSGKHTLVILEGGNGNDPRALATTASLVRTLRLRP
jgi:hypothetical protein